MNSNFLNAAMLAILVGSAGQFAHAESEKDGAPVSAKVALPKNVSWTEIGPGEYRAKLFGDESKPGIYGVLIKWMPDHFSKPHTDSQQRFMYVLSGTMWVSSSTSSDPAQTYPLQEGSSAVEKANTIHWGGAKAETGPVIVEFVGEGPVSPER